MGSESRAHPAPVASRQSPVASRQSPVSHYARSEQQAPSAPPPASKPAARNPTRPPHHAAFPPNRGKLDGVTRPACLESPHRPPQPDGAYRARCCPATVASRPHGLTASRHHGLIVERHRVFLCPHGPLPPCQLIRLHFPSESQRRLTTMSRPAPSSCFGPRQSHYDTTSCHALGPLGHPCGCRCAPTFHHSCDDDDAMVAY